MALWVRTLAMQAKGWVFESKPRQTNVIKTSYDSSTAKRSALCVARLRTLTAQWPLVLSIGQHLQPFTGNGDVSKWVKNSLVEGRTPNKQTNKQKPAYLKVQAFFIIDVHVLNSKLKVIMQLSIKNILFESNHMTFSITWTIIVVLAQGNIYYEW